MDSVSRPAATNIGRDFGGVVLGTTLFPERAVQRIERDIGHNRIYAFVDVLEDFCHTGYGNKIFVLQSLLDRGLCSLLSEKFAANEFEPRIAVVLRQGSY